MVHIELLNCGNEGEGDKQHVPTPLVLAAAGSESVWCTVPAVAMISKSLRSVSDAQLPPGH